MTEKTRGQCPHPGLCQPLSADPGSVCLLFSDGRTGSRGLASWPGMDAPPTASCLWTLMAVGSRGSLMGPHHQSKLLLGGSCPS